MAVKYIIGVGLAILLAGVGVASADVIVSGMSLADMSNSVSSVIAEPSTLVLFGFGLAGLGLLRRGTK